MPQLLHFCHQRPIEEVKFGTGLEYNSELEGIRLIEKLKICFDVEESLGNLNEFARSISRVNKVCLLGKHQCPKLPANTQLIDQNIQALKLITMKTRSLALKHVIGDTTILDMILKNLEYFTNLESISLTLNFLNISNLDRIHEIPQLKNIYLNCDYISQHPPSANRVISILSEFNPKQLEKLVFDYYHLPYTQTTLSSFPMLVLKSCMANLTHLTTLEICFYFEGFSNYLHLFAELKHMQHFKLPLGQFDFAILVHWRKLRTLTIDSIPPEIHPCHLKCIENLESFTVKSSCQRRSFNHELLKISLEQSIKLNRLFISESMCFQIGSFLENNCHLKQLKYYSSSDCNKFMIERLSKSSCLEKLLITLADTPCYKLEAQDVLENSQLMVRNTSIKKFRLTNQSSFADICISQVLQRIDFRFLTNLHSLTIEKINFDSSCQTISHFSYLLTDRDSKLRTLKLKQVKLMDGCLDKFYQLCQSSDCKLRQLSIEFDFKHREQNWDNIILFLQKNTSLETLKLDLAMKSTCILGLFLGAVSQHPRLRNLSCRVELCKDDLLKKNNFKCIVASVDKYCQRLKNFEIVCQEEISYYFRVVHQVELWELKKECFKQLVEKLQNAEKIIIK